jgi:hypothetical protein
MKYYIDYIDGKAYLCEYPPELDNPRDKLQILLAIINKDQNPEVRIDRKSINIPDEYKNRPLLDLVRPRPLTDDD